MAGALILSLIYVLFAVVGAMTGMAFIDGLKSRD